MLSEEKSRQIEMAGTDWACMMLVCINGHENNEPYGVIANYHLSHPVSFRGIHRLILALDEVCEMVGSPMATTEPRFLLNEWEQQYRALKAVSYTHLDVYKRQELWRAVCLWRADRREVP